MDSRMEAPHAETIAPYLKVIFRDGMMGSSMCLPRAQLGDSIRSVQDVFDVARPVLLSADCASRFTPQRGYVSLRAAWGRLDSVRLEDLPSIEAQNLLEVTFTNY